MGPIKCEIVLKEKSKIYFPSEIVQGTVKICTKSATNISKMELILLGQGNFGTDNHQPFPVYSETKCVQLNKILPSGVERFPINWTLPYGLVSSFKWRSGCVNYHFVVKIGVKQRHGCTRDEVVTSAPVPIGIHNSVDLNQLPLQIASAEEFHSRLACDGQGIPLRGHVFLGLVLNRKCFIPGEDLNFNCAVRIETPPENDGWVQKKIFRGITLNLDEEISYFKNGQAKYLVTNVAQKTGDSAVIRIQRFQSHSTTSVWKDAITIPSFCNSTPPEFEGTGIVCVSYFLNVSLTLSTLSALNNSRPDQDAQQSQFRIPLVIGGIPLEEPLSCEVQMALMTSSPLLNWGEEDIEEELRRRVQSDDPAPELDNLFPINPPPETRKIINYLSSWPVCVCGHNNSKNMHNIQHVSFLAPPTYAAAIRMTNGTESESTDENPPEYVP